jgi:gliding motility-associated-like protein
MHRVPVGFDPTFYCESRNLNICFVKELESIECENPLFSYESLLNYNLDTTAWVKRTSLIRGQGQKYMKIGNYFNYQQSTELSNCVSRVLANGSGYNFVDDFKLFELSLLPDTIFICDNSQYIYQLQYVDNESYYLNNQEINDFIILDSEGVYTIERKFSDLSYYDTLTLISIYDYVEVLRDDILICEGEDFRLSDYINVELFDSININGYLDVSEILYEGNYEFEFFMECGSDIFTLNLLNSTCNCTEYIPNSFSPNYDGVNDVFMPNIFCEDSDLLYMNIKIFDRWGGLVYSQNGDNIIGWNGLGMNNETMENGAYAYVLEYQYTVYSGIIRDKIVYGDLVLLK